MTHWLTYLTDASDCKRTVYQGFVDALLRWVCTVRYGEWCQLDIASLQYQTIAKVSAHAFATYAGSDCEYITLP
jgi:hypothetical protein